MATRPRPRKEVLRTKEYDVHIVGGASPGLRDLYHAMLTVPWWALAGLIALAYLGLNTLFAGLYLATGGLANAHEDSFADAFFFSVQTMGTIGYGAIAPASRAANLVVVAESIVSLGFTALATGLVFVRFSLQRARILFSKRACIGRMDGIPTLMLRVGNERRGRIVDASFRLSLTRTVQTTEGVTMYRAVDLTLVRDRAAALQRAWAVMHAIAPGSPLDGVTAEALASSEAELTLLVSGIDDTTMQPVHALNTWMASDVIFGHRMADIVSDLPGGDMLVDLSRCHDVVPVDESR